MLTSKVKNYPNHNCNQGPRLSLYVLMEMLVEFKIMHKHIMPVSAGQLNNLHWDIEHDYYSKRQNNEHTSADEHII